jgi:hypothetical protein
MQGIGSALSRATAAGPATAVAEAAAPSPEAVQEPTRHPPFADEDEQTRISDGVGGLASAFSQAVAAPESNLKELSVPSDEWYVGINGVPVGPIRLSELRSKAAVGAITLDSLVWREGFEEWQALRTFPELVAIVEESLSSARASFNPASPSSPYGSGLGLTPAIVGPVVAQDPFAPTPGAPSATLAGGLPFTSSTGAVAPVTGPIVATDGALDLDAAAMRRATGSSPAAWIAVAVALLFGLTIGFVLFSRQAPRQTVVQYVEVPAKNPAQNHAASQPETIEEATVSGSSKIAKGGPAAAKSAEKTEQKTGLSGLSGLDRLQGGPRASPGSESGSASTGQQLDSTTIQRTVSRYTGSVKRSCWQPALDTRTQDAPTSARVNVTITVGPSGSVQNASTSGEPQGYRGLASCIGSRVRGWQFPASGGTTTINVPFVFAAQ